MNEYEVTPYLPDDILISRIGVDVVWLKSALDEMVKFTEVFLCEANARPVYDVACILEDAAADLRKQYNIWKLRNFEEER